MNINDLKSHLHDLQWERDTLRANIADHPDGEYREWLIEWYWETRDQIARVKAELKDKIARQHNTHKAYTLAITGRIA